MQPIDVSEEAPARSGQRSLVLVGMMGAGKSSVGRVLATRLGLPFTDSDEEVVRAAGCSIEDIFEHYGEPAFRDVEARVIKRLLSGPRQVLATGGGAFMNADTRAVLAGTAISVWLDADLETLVRRTSRRGGRPLLKGPDPRARLESLLKERGPIYSLADIRVTSGKEPAETTADRVLDAMGGLKKGGQPSNDGPAEATVTGDARP